ncbi:hypothetical protein Ciccas_012867, partial [Cichlidogyrus casuarinus]
MAVNVEQSSLIFLVQNLITTQKKISEQYRDALQTSASSHSTPPERSTSPTDDRECFNCGVDFSVLWRRHPVSQQYLCNACGLYLKVNKRDRPSEWSISRKRRLIRKRKQPVQPSIFEYQSLQNNVPLQSIS